MATKFSSRPEAQPLASADFTMFVQDGNNVKVHSEQIYDYVEDMLNRETLSTTDQIEADIDPSEVGRSRLTTTHTSITTPAEVGIIHVLYDANVEVGKKIIVDQLGGTIYGVSFDTEWADNEYVVKGELGSIEYGLHTKGVNTRLVLEYIGNKVWWLSGQYLQQNAVLSGSGNVMEATAPGNAVLSGFGNVMEATAPGNAVLSGFRNKLSSTAYSSITGGQSNSISGGTASSILTGNTNKLTSTTFSAIGAGMNNEIINGGPGNFVAGGSGNKMNGTAFSFIGAGGGNEVEVSASYGAVVAGQDNTVSNNFSAILAGQSNTAGGSYSSISGGRNNTTTDYLGFIGGGSNNTTSGSPSGIVTGANNQAFGWGSFIGGGRYNVNRSYAAVIGGGDSNEIQDSCYAGTIAGGKTNLLKGGYSGFIGGGYNNQNDKSYAGFIGAGRNNIIRDAYAGVICGGYQNRVMGYVSAIVGGDENVIGDFVGNNGAEYSFIGGGSGNVMIHGEFSAITGGHGNVLNGVYNFIGGGYQNAVGGSFNSVVGGNGNTVGGSFNSVLGGMYNNLSNGSFSVITGGHAVSCLDASNAGIFTGYDNTVQNNYYGVILSGSGNTVSADFGTILNGTGCIASGKFSIVAGVGAQDRGINFTQIYGASTHNRTVIAQTVTTTNVLVDTNLQAPYLTTPVDNSNKHYVIPQSVCALFEAQIMARSTHEYVSGSAVALTYANKKAKSWTVKGMVKRGSDVGEMALVGIPVITELFSDVGSEAWDVDVSIDAANGFLVFTVKGDATKRITFTSDVKLMETPF